MDEALAVDLRKICRALEPWTLACAVGAMNGSIYGEIGAHGRLDFDTWLLCVNKDKWPRSGGVEAALRVYANDNKHKHMNEVFKEEEARQRRRQDWTP